MGRTSSTEIDNVAGQASDSRPPRLMSPANNSISNGVGFRPARLLVICGVLLAAAVTIGAGLVLSNLREHALAGREPYIIGIAALLILVIGTTILLGAKQLKNFEVLAKARVENDQKAQLDAALNNMRQGLQMYDAEGRVILTNQKYLKM